MEEAIEVQVKLFERIRKRLPSHMSLVEEVATVLDKSIDSCYRRIRGEKIIRLDELVKLCTHFQVSFDKLIEDSSTQLPISFVAVDENEFSVVDFLATLEFYLRGVLRASEKEAIYVSNDLPLFQIFQIPELVQFKFFFWQKSSLNFESFKHRKFSLKNLAHDIARRCEKTYMLYKDIPSCEIISTKPVDNILRQIGYYLESGFFEDKSDAVILCDRLIDLINHLNTQAMLGMKFHVSEQPNGSSENFKLFSNDLFIVDVIVLVKADEERRTFFATNPLNYMQTDNQNFFDSYALWIDNLLTKCERLTDTSEKQRNRFFLSQIEQVTAFRDSI